MALNDADNIQQDGQVRSVELREDMHIVIVGHVDHGKSTIIGRMLADTGSLPDGKLEFVRETCRRNSKPFEYAFLLDALKDEQSQGITIDAARCFFKTNKRHYIIIDAPGHIEFLKNMVTGAARAEAALLVIDAVEGVQENSRRHGYMLGMLGIKQVSVLINKMDLVDYRQEVYNVIRKNYLEFLGKIGVQTSSFVPVSGLEGDNIAYSSSRMGWFRGKTVIEVLDDFQAEKAPEDKPFRMPVQGVYKFTRHGDTRRIVAGSIESGRISVGDEVIFYPSGKKSTVKTIESFNEASRTSIGAGYAAGFTLTEQIYVNRGEVATLLKQPRPLVTSRIRANIFWLGKEPMEKGVDYILKLGTNRVSARLEEILMVIDASTLKNKKKVCIECHDVAECILKLERHIAFDLPEEVVQTGRFVIVDRYEIAGGGIAQESLQDEQSRVREKVHLRNYKWEKNLITEEERGERYNQRSCLILLTGPPDIERKPVAKALEQKLFTEGKFIYFLGIGNVLYGIDADIKLSEQNNREEHLRRLAEVSNLMIDAGLILIVTARELSQADLELMKMAVNPEKIQTVWLGEDITTDITFNLHIPDTTSIKKNVAQIKEYMQKRGIIFKLW